MFLNFRRERAIRRTLRGLARQRVVMTLATPRAGPIHVVENAIARDDDTEATLLTCHSRGWVEVLYDNVPHGALTPDQKLPSKFFGPPRTVYQLTPEGWAVINRSHFWTVAGVVVGLAALAASIALAFYFGR